MKMTFIILLNILIYSGGLMFCLKKGVRNNLIFFFSWILFVIYHFISPLYFYLIGRKTIWGDEPGYQGVGSDISHYYDDGFLYYGIANLLFFIGFFFITSATSKNKPVIYKDSKRIIASILMVCITLVVVNYAISGINLIDILRGDADNTLFGAVGATNYLKNFADSIITCLIICTLARVNKYFLTGSYLLAMVLFLLMGFRYRIIISILGLLGILFLQRRIKIQHFAKNAIVLLAVFYIFLCITVNRYAFITGDYQSMKFNPREFHTLTLLAEQTRGMLDDISIIKYYEETSIPEYDYGASFLYFAVRAVPRVVAGDWKDSMYPPEAFKIISKIFNLPAEWASTGEAPLHYAYFLIAGNVGILFLGAFITGLILGLVQRRIQTNESKGQVLMIIICLALFSWYTRGYFPQLVDNLVFLLIPFWLYYYLIPRYEG